MARSGASTLAQASLSLAQQLFPTADPAFLSNCVSHHVSSLSKNVVPAEAAAARIVQLVSHKLLDENPHGTAGEWPTVKCWKVVDEAVEERELDVELPRPATNRRDSRRTRAPSSLTETQGLRAAFMRESGREPTGRRRRRRVVDITTERNLALYVSAPLPAFGCCDCAQIDQTPWGTPTESACTPCSPSCRSQTCAP